MMRGRRASRRFRFRESVDFSMSSEWPISTAVMPSCWRELGQQRELAGGDAERPQRVVVDARDDAASCRTRVEMQAADVLSAMSLMLGRCGRDTGCHDVHWGIPRPVIYP